MLKVKLFAVVVFLSLAAIVSSISPIFVSKAENDTIVQQISDYKKNWQRINKVPIKVSGGFQIDGVSGSEQTFMIDGQEVTNFRPGDLGG
jgi:hypothetical protein